MEFITKNIQKITDKNITLICNNYSKQGDRVTIKKSLISNSEGYA